MGFLVGVIRLSSNWLFRNIAYVYVEFTRNVPVLLQIILYYSILLHLPKIKQAIEIFDGLIHIILVALTEFSVLYCAL